MKVKGRGIMNYNNSFCRFFSFDEVVLNLLTSPFSFFLGKKRNRKTARDGFEPDSYRVHSLRSLHS